MLAVTESPEVQRRITWAICSRIKVERGSVTEVDVRKEVAPLFVLAASSSMPRSRPDLGPGRQSILLGVEIRGLPMLLGVELLGVEVPA